MIGMTMRPITIDDVTAREVAESIHDAIESFGRYVIADTDAAGNGED